MISLSKRIVPNSVQAPQMKRKFIMGLIVGLRLDIWDNRIDYGWEAATATMWDAPAKIHVLVAYSARISK